MDELHLGSKSEFLVLPPCKLLKGAIPAQAAMASAVASLSLPPVMGVQWSNGVCVCVCVFVCV